MVHNKVGTLASALGACVKEMQVIVGSNDSEILLFSSLVTTWARARCDAVRCAVHEFGRLNLSPLVFTSSPSRGLFTSHQRYPNS
jgi:hypothetical protein